jgi:hypothetical protein
MAWSGKCKIGNKYASQMFIIFRFPKNRQTKRNKYENNSAGFAGTVILVFLMYYFCIVWKSEKSENLAGACFAYCLFSAPRPPCLGPRTLQREPRRRVTVQSRQTRIMPFQGIHDP